MGLKSKIADWWCPRRVCEREGHDYKPVFITGLQYPSSAGVFMADRVSCKIDECQRCGQRGPRESFAVESREPRPLHMLPLTSSELSQLERSGFLED